MIPYKTDLGPKIPVLASKLEKANEKYLELIETAQSYMRGNNPQTVYAEACTRLAKEMREGYIPYLAGLLEDMEMEHDRYKRMLEEQQNHIKAEAWRDAQKPGSHGLTRPPRPTPKG